MKLKATSSCRDLRGYSLDPTDLFLLSRLDDELTAEELADISVCDGAETTRRVRALVGYGLVAIIDSSASEPTVAAPANDNASRRYTASTVPPPDASYSDAHLDLRATLPFVRANRRTFRPT